MVWPPRSVLTRRRRSSRVPRGVVNTFGVFQAYYSTHFLSHVSDSSISWIGSVHACLICLLGFATGPLFDIGYAYALLYTGSLLIVFGMFMTSLCTEYWQLMLAQGVCIGLGSGCLFIPSVGIVSTYFSTRKALATGLGVSGSSVAGVVYPIVFAKLQPRIGFPWAARVIAFMMLATLAVAVSLFRVRVLPPEKRRLMDLSAFREVPFTAFNFVSFFTTVGLYVPYFYISSYCTEHSITTADLAFYMVPILSAGSAFGRIVPNFFADTTGPLNMLLVCNACAAVLAYCWPAIHNTPGAIVFCVLYGFFSGAFVSLQAATVVSLSPSLRVFGTRMGMTSFSCGLGILVGNPVAGAIMGGGCWLGMMLFCACALALGTGFAVVARFARTWDLMAQV